MLHKNDGILSSVEYLYNAKKIVSLKHGSCVLYMAGKVACYSSNTSEQTLHEKCSPSRKNQFYFSKFCLYKFSAETHFKNTEFH